MAKMFFFQPRKRRKANSLPLCIIYFKEMQIATSDYTWPFCPTIVYSFSLVSETDFFYSIKTFTVLNSFEKDKNVEWCIRVLHNPNSLI